jgi:hypothetical protein
MIEVDMILSCIYDSLWLVLLVPSFTLSHDVQQDLQFRYPFSPDETSQRKSVCFISLSCLSVFATGNAINSLSLSFVLLAPRKLSLPLFLLCVPHSDKALGESLLGFAQQVKNFWTSQCER